MADIDDIRREIGIARQELQDLKHCQLQYFSIAIASTGSIFGLAGILMNKIPGLDNLGGWAFLAPLSVILPSWIIFFDKATSITRIVGYQRILEKLLKKQDEYEYIGYENALAEFRKNEKRAWKKIRGEEKKEEKKKDNSDGQALLLTRHRYWVINWITFLILSLICLIGYVFLSKNNQIVDLTLPFGIHFLAPKLTVWITPPFALVIFCLAYTYWLFLLLTHGRLSYNNCTKIWQHILAKTKEE